MEKRQEKKENKGKRFLTQNFTFPTIGLSMDYCKKLFFIYLPNLMLKFKSNTKL
jgi:hypothetical protein